MLAHVKVSYHFPRGVGLLPELVDDLTGARW